MTGKKYAAGTKISSEKSEMDIRKMLKRFGATAYAFYDKEPYIGFSFEFADRRVRITLELPDPDAEEFVYTNVNQSSARKARSKQSQYDFWERECDRRWRALVLTVKAKLIAVEEGIRTFEQEFLYDIVIPATNQTVGDWIKPQIEQSYLTGKLPPLLPGIGETS